MGRRRIEREANGYTLNHNRSNWAIGRARTELRHRHLSEYWQLCEEIYREVDVSKGQNRRDRDLIRNRVYNMAYSRLKTKHRDEFELIKAEQYKVYDDMKEQGDL